MANYKTIQFFLSETEQRDLLKIIENKNTIYYVECGHFEINKIIKYHSIDEFLPMIKPHIGEHLYSSWIILPQNIDFVFEHADVLGEKVVTVYPLHGNESAIVYHPGGIYKETNVIHGEFCILSNNTEMTDVFKQIRTSLGKMSIKKSSYFIGKETYNNKNKYNRFITISVKSPIEYDLKL